MCSFLLLYVISHSFMKIGEASKGTLIFHHSFSMVVLNKKLKAFFPFGYRLLRCCRSWSNFVSNSLPSGVFSRFNPQTDDTHVAIFSTRFSTISKAKKETSVVASCSTFSLASFAKAKGPQSRSGISYSRSMREIVNAVLKCELVR